MARMKSFNLYDHEWEEKATNKAFNSDESQYGIFVDLRHSIMGSPEFMCALRELAPKCNRAVELGTPARPLDAALAVLILFARDLEPIQINHGHSRPSSELLHAVDPVPLLFNILFPPAHQVFELPSPPKLRRLTIDLMPACRPYRSRLLLV
ncbi:hypothetical protein P171DRAFT_429504 [Karstenula rhodostoma CBS 690.94]|uniref:Uncharacterized protein n=1 Tax=Karstenula rhodostoma CBS 690.94 TaxID=1392251 RepID=A0A9P4PPS4_9PLEO|nr:hypothetical protein P171DRAFT_429504 [Karstenula rhodostoma CBS 690.94]